MIETNKTYNENCLDTMSKLSDNSIDLVVTSPPYDDQRTYKGYSFNFEKTANELFRVIKDNRIVVWIVGDKIEKHFRKLTSINQLLYFHKIGFNIYDIMIYAKKSTPPMGCGKRYITSFEYMFILSKGIPEITNIQKEKCLQPIRKYNLTRRSVDGSKQIYRDITTNEYKYINNVWLLNTGYNHSTKDKIAFNHPAVFPEILCERHVLSWSNKNDLVYDCFMGSGTTAKICIINSRNYIGSEISKEYCDLIEQRIKPYKIQTNLNI